MDTLFYLIEKFPREFPHDQIPSPIRAAIQKTEQIYGEAFMREAIDKCYDRGVMNLEYLRTVVGSMIEDRKKEEKKKADLKKKIDSVQRKAQAEGKMFVLTWNDKERKPRIISEDEAITIGVEMKSSSHVTIIGIDGLQAEIANKYDIKNIREQKQIEGQQLAQCSFICEWGTRHNALSNCDCYHTYGVEWWTIWDILREKGHTLVYGKHVTPDLLTLALAELKK